MKKKFEIGDRVRIKDTDVVGEVISTVKSANVYLVLLDKAHTSLPFPEHKLEFTNPKEAFLTRLQELLATFDAEIGVCLDYTATEEAMVLLNGKIVAAGRTITAENIIDYDND